jgi:flavin reductase (DIM6/NTAB) family NADH-FMN oxidoreductase RutF
MVKTKIRVGPYLYPMPVVIVGAHVNGKPNFMPIAWVSIVEHKPPMISISANQSHYTNKGIKENQEFSINTPSVDIVKAMDYCGLKSGKDLDKSGVFDLFYGDLENAPMIKEARLNLECKLAMTFDTKKGHDIFIGEIINAYAEENIMHGEIPDFTKLQPVIFSMNDNNYWKIGEKIGGAWSIGRDFKKD